MKKILILGGTNFVGRRFTEKLLNNPDYQISLFNRNKSNPDLFEGLEKISGDRETDDINKISSREWDIIVDFSAYYSDTLEKMLKIMKSKVGRYIFISTVSVYPLDKYSGQIIDESFDIVSVSEDEKTRVRELSYDKKKAECERVLSAQDWLDKIILRPSLIYGKYDPTDRFYYWLYRIMNKKKILLPDTKSIMNLSYAEDMADIITAFLTKKNNHEIYNVSTHEPLKLEEIINTITEVSGNNPELIKLSTEKLEKMGLKQWMDIPLWIESDMAFDHSKVLEDTGIKPKSFKESVAETLKAFDTSNEGNYGIRSERETEIINKLENE